MISRIEGELIQIQDGRALVKTGALTYEVLVPAADEQRLFRDVDQTVAFETLHYLESQNQGAMMTPRLVGFRSVEDRAFFELFTTVKGIGPRKALRALQLPFAEIAIAIAEKDAVLLKSLPEIGKRTAETIIAELRGKVDPFVDAAAVSRAGASSAADDAAVAPTTSRIIELKRDTVAMLVELGETRLIAQQLVERAMDQEPEVDAPGELLAACFRVKGS